MRWPPPSKPGEVNHDLVDRFTFVHVAVGVACGFAGFGLVAIVVLVVVWELVENPMKAYLPRLFPHATSDTPGNAVVDALAALAGWGAVQLLS